MLAYRKFAFLLVFGVCLGAPPGPAHAAANADASNTEPACTASLGQGCRDGFVSLRYEEKTGRLLLLVDRLDKDFLYVHGVASGLGAPHGMGPKGAAVPQIDRGEFEYTHLFGQSLFGKDDVSGNEAVVHFERHGSRLLLIESNQAFRALSEDEAERDAVAQSFPPSVLGVFPIIENVTAGTYLVDATDFFLGDPSDIQGRMRAQGIEVQLDRERSYLDAEYTRAFPDNSEFRAALSFSVSNPPPGLKRLVRDARSFALEQHHSFVRLPPPGFKPRRPDPRIGNRHVEFWDFSQSFDEGQYRERYLWRWRLEKKDPEAAVSEPVRPIVYHLDPAMPEPYRSAVKESFVWWNEAFEKAGFRNALELRDLPDGADPMDARYSVILWTHQAGQGYSTAPQFFDPRTGEILKAIVRLDSHRGLHNYNLFAALQPAVEATGGSTVSAVEFVSSVRHWHTTHEVGHSLGFEHNFLGEAVGGSMMDYRPARYDVDAQGALDLSGALRGRIGAYDHALVRYAYTPFDTPQEEAAGLQSIVGDALDQGLRYLVDADASLSGSVPQAHRWITGGDVKESLKRTMEVRRVGLQHFDERAVRRGERMWLLANRLTHLYLLHLYQLDAVTKYVGGQDYSYALRGDGQTPARVFPASEQRDALALVLSALAPGELEVPERITTLIPPLPYGEHGADLYIRSSTGPVFDALTLPRTLAHHVVKNLLHPERASRLVSFHARDDQHLSLHEVLQRLVEATWEAAPQGDSLARTLQRISQRAVLEGLFRLAGDDSTPDEVQAAADHRLALLAETLAAGDFPDARDQAHRAKALREINRYLGSGVVPALQTGVFDMIRDVKAYRRWP